LKELNVNTVVHALLSWEIKWFWKNKILNI
jgi:hypothetical protein